MSSEDQNDHEFSQMTEDDWAEQRTLSTADAKKDKPFSKLYDFDEMNMYCEWTPEGLKNALLELFGSDFFQWLLTKDVDDSRKLPTDREFCMELGYDWSKHADRIGCNATHHDSFDVYAKDFVAYNGDGLERIVERILKKAKWWPGFRCLELQIWTKYVHIMVSGGISRLKIDDVCNGNVENCNALGCIKHCNENGIATTGGQFWTDFLAGKNRKIERLSFK